MLIVPISEPADESPRVHPSGATVYVEDGGEYTNFVALTELMATSLGDHIPHH